MRRLLSVERHQKILERVASESAVDFVSLAEELGVSSMTIRRDVRILEEAGHITTTRGGASAQVTNTKDILTNPRAQDQSAAKAQIGQFAASLIEKGEVIFLGTGSTTAVFAQFLPSNLDLTVITPSLPHASVLASRGLNVVSTGGVVATADLAQTGVIAQEVLQRFFATRTIIGTGGVSKIGGLTEFDQSVADLNRVMVERSEEVMVLVDPSKSGVTANFRVAGIEVVEEFITSNEGRKILEKELGSSARVLTPNM
ncbi:MAG: DeoR/GlpR transcriptional regulator [Actinobacteria bacterium]|jgi:DeoR family transcriptional regulator, aga operon transcriptional repressor|nr:DeoR/GlpR transcriptional regulator [Actinomycetota bacterium]